MRQLIRLTVLAIAFTGVVAAAQQPKIVHAELTSKSASKGIAGEIEALKKAGGVTWVGYSIPVTPRYSHDGNDGTAYLEGEHQSASVEHENEAKAQTSAVLLMRIAGGMVEKVRVENPDRSIDAGGMHVVWLTDVAVEDSVNTLVNLAKEKDSKKLRHGAVFAISIHATPKATQALITLADAGNELGLREKAAFWLASQHGHDGFVAMQRWAKDDADDAFREKLTFDFTLSKDPEAIQELVRMAHHDSSIRVRKQAQFWMAQKGGKAVSGDLRDLAENDPEASLRKSAVFAISRLPQEEATPQLIQLAQTGKDPGVRKKAVFWLGQSQDPRALDYLTQLLQR